MVAFYGWFIGEWFVSLHTVRIATDAAYSSWDRWCPICWKCSPQIQTRHMWSLIEAHAKAKQRNRARMIVFILFTHAKVDSSSSSRGRCSVILKRFSQQTSIFRAMNAWTYHTNRSLSVEKVNKDQAPILRRENGPRNENNNIIDGSDRWSWLSI